MYEIASQCGSVLAASSKSAAAAVMSAATSNLEDSYAQLGIRQLTSATAMLSRS